MRNVMTLLVSVLILLAPELTHAKEQRGMSNYCNSFESAHGLLELEDIDAVRNEVELRYYHALDVSQAPTTIYSQSSVFTWANEAKVSCAKALGFLNRRFKWRPVVNNEAIQKCECFYVRMINYLR